MKIIALSSLAVLSGLMAVVWMANPSSRVVVIGQTRINVELAVTGQDHYAGLSGRESLPDDSGMLFVFDPADNPVFVMRSMNFPLDIIWISDNKVIKIDEFLKPEGATPEEHYLAPGPIDYVLEVNAGFSARHHLSVGDNFSLEPKNIF
jgi:uncharacterized membrane protein (UPF0127 family)